MKQGIVLYKRQSNTPYTGVLLYAMLRRLDSNERPPGYEPGELPTAPLRELVLKFECKVTAKDSNKQMFRRIILNGADFFILKRCIIMKLDSNSDKPLHIQAEEVLRILIKFDEYKNGKLLNVWFSNGCAATRSFRSSISFLILTRPYPCPATRILRSRCIACSRTPMASS